jgi:hypothetical protein
VGEKKRDLERFGLAISKCLIATAVRPFHPSFQSSCLPVRRFLPRPPPASPGIRAAPRSRPHVSPRLRIALDVGPSRDLRPAIGRQAALPLGLTKFVTVITNLCPDACPISERTYSSSSSSLFMPSPEHIVGGSPKPKKSNRTRQSHPGNVPTIPQSEKCDTCGAKFTRQSHLKRHQLTRQFFRPVLPPSSDICY